MGDIRTALGVALAISLTVIILLGFFATSSRDLLLVFFGFSSGLISVFLVEHLKIGRARQRQSS